jgi:hypothetical protein
MLAHAAETYPNALDGYKLSAVESHQAARPGRLRPFASPTVNQFCVALLYGHAGRLTARNGDFRPGQAGKVDTSGTAKVARRPRPLHPRSRAAAAGTACCGRDSKCGSGF